MIQIQNLTYAYPLSTQPALRDVSLKIPRGTLTVLRGASGCGKSTLLYCLNGIIPHLLGGDLRGEVTVGGVRPRDISLGRMARIVGTVFQNPDLQIFMPTVWEDAQFGCVNAGMPQAQCHGRAREALAQMQLGQLAAAQTGVLSAGQKQRLAIAGVYAVGPSVFLFDEPMVNLDERGRRGFIECVQGLKKKGATVIVAEHDPAGLMEIADNRLTISGGRIRQDSGEEGEPAGMRDLSRQDASVNTAVLLKDVCFGYGEASHLFDGLDLEIKEGESVAILGDNGSGKTTLLKLMMGILLPKKGTVRICGTVIYSPDDLAGKAGMLFQNPDEHLFNNTVEEEISFGPKRMRMPFCVDEALADCGLLEKRQRHPHALSRGERQRLAFASVLSMRPGVVILDEPTTSLDRDNWIRLMESARGKSRTPVTVIFATHHQQVVRQFATRVIRLEKGSIVGDEIRG